MAKLLCAFTLFVLTTFVSQSVSAGKHKDKQPTVVGRTQPIYTCPPGYEPRPNGLCGKFMPTPPKAMCPTGVLLGDRCAIHEPPIEKCAAGYTLSDGKKHNRDCIKVETVPAFPKCREGEIQPHGGCLVKMSTRALMICPNSGGKHKSGLEGCFDSKPVSPLLYCAGGFTLQENVCYGKELRGCPAPDKKGSPCVGKHCSMHRLLGKKHSTVKMQTCEVPVYTPPLEKCPPNSSSDSGHKNGRLTCFVRFPIQPEATCPLPGATLQGDMCYAHNIVAPHFICPSGFNDCSKKSGSGQMCCNTYSAPPQLYCPHGLIMEGGRCVSYQKPMFACHGVSKFVDGKCLMEHTVGAIASYKLQIQAPAKMPPPPTKKGF